MSSLGPTTGLRLLDRHFRWRSDSVSRLEGFSDAVFAIVLALLFLRAAPPDTFTDLEAAMKGLVPFAVTFTIIAYVWVEHWLYSRRYGLQDGWATLLNLLLLFLLLFYAYPLKFLFTLIFVSLFGSIGELNQARMLVGCNTAADHSRLFVFYSVGYSSIFLVLALLYTRALRLHAQLGLNRIERFLTRSAIVQTLLQSGISAVSIVLALTQFGLHYGLAGWIYCLIGPLMAVHGSWEGRRLVRLRSEGLEPRAGTGHG